MIQHIPAYGHALVQKLYLWSLDFTLSCPNFHARGKSGDSGAFSGATGSLTSMFSCFAQLQMVRSIEIQCSINGEKDSLNNIPALFIDNIYS